MVFAQPPSPTLIDQQALETEPVVLVRMRRVEAAIYESTVIEQTVPVIPLVVQVPLVTAL